ncbi:alpha/beta hydrolase family protein [Parerythrobacter aestuarii]|uniref:alpha/beta hydrolase family protein n=1 Tax=Parerythrobacter aestuarii TaxID=3020909 RepID=UPI0024DE3570|nr:S9 family peptidase [Parerythrobacter aestuarii]
MNRRIARALSAFAGAAMSLPLHAQQPAPPLEAYGDLEAVESAEISPTGRFSAMVMTVGGERQVLVFDATGAPVQRFVIGDTKVRWIEWVGDSAILLVRSETGRVGRLYGNRKREWFRANVIPLDPNGEIISVFANQRNIANAIVGYHGVRQVDGRWLGYFGGFMKGRSSGEGERILNGNPALFAVDLTTGKANQVAYPSQYPIGRDWQVGANGKVAATLETNYENGDWKIEGPSGQRIASGNSPRGSIGLVGLGAGGDTIIYSTFNEDEESAVRYEVPLNGGEATEVYDVRVRQWIRNSYDGRVLGAITPWGDVRMADAATEETLEKTLGLFSRVHQTLADNTPDMGTVIVRTSGNYDSGSWYRVDTTTGQRMLMGLERPAIQGPAIGKISTFEYSASDGLEMDAILTLPPGKPAKGLPVVVMPHGGPTAHDSPVFDWWAQAFASRGYAVLQPNFRGSTHKGEAFRAAGDGEWGRKMQTDISDGLAALAEAGIADARRACIVGASYGGYAALAGVTLQNDIYRCAVSVNGVADLRTMFRDALTGSRTIFRNSVEQYFGKDADLDALSPTKLADRADAPVLIIHGRDDTRVPYEQGLRMEDALADAGKDVSFVTLEGEDHFLSSAATRKQTLLESVNFVIRHNPPN